MKHGRSLKVVAFVCILYVVCTGLPSQAYASHHNRGLRLTSHKAFRFRHRQSTGTCEPIVVSLCKDIGYNLTDVSLSPGNITHQEEVMPYVSLINGLACAEEMKLLFCSIYTPICLPSYKKFLPPCRFICEQARSRCEPLVKNYFGTQWPTIFTCKHFPEYLPNSQLCLHFNKSFSTKIPAPPRSTQPYLPRANETPPVFPTPAESVKCRCACSERLVVVADKNDPIYGKVVTGGVKDCAIPCRSPYFSKEKVQFVEAWITAWSVACFSVTLLTVSTYLIDKERFKYPERPVILLSTCYMFVSIGFLIRVVAGHEAVACTWSSDRVLYKTTGPFLCGTVFLLIYFFGMAGSLWWVILTLVWFLTAGLKWNSDAVTKCSNYFHAVAWLLPALQSIAVLAMSRVDGDDLSGICYVGSQDVESLRGFVSIPLLVHLGLGGLFLLLGFVNLFRIRKSIKKVGCEAAKLEKLMGRIGLFSLLYMIPSFALVSCFLYEQSSRNAWAETLNCPSNCTTSARPRPEFAVYVVKYSVMLLIGVTNGVWVCSPKTIASWRHFYKQCSKIPLLYNVVGRVKASSLRTSSTAISSRKKRANLGLLKSACCRRASNNLSTVVESAAVNALNSRKDVVIGAEKSESFSMDQSRRRECPCVCNEEHQQRICEGVNAVSAEETDCFISFAESSEDAPTLASNDVVRDDASCSGVVCSSLLPPRNAPTSAPLDRIPVIQEQVCKDCEFGKRRCGRMAYERQSCYDACGSVRCVHHIHHHHHHHHLSPVCRRSFNKHSKRRLLFSNRLSTSNSGGNEHVRIVHAVDRASPTSHHLLQR